MATDKSTTRSERDPVQKALEILSYIVEQDRGAVGVREIGQELEMTPSASHRALNALGKAGYLVRTNESRYALSLDFYRLARAAVSSFPIEDVALPAMRDLEGRINESVYLMLYDRGKKRTIIPTKVECSHPIRHVVETMTWQTVFESATGMTIFAFLDPDEQEVLAREAGREATDLEAMNAELRRVGHAIMHPPGVEDAWAVVAPIGVDKGLIGAVSVPVPASRFSDNERAGIPRAVAQCAAELEALLMRSTG